MKELSKELNRIYKEYPACWENDENWEGFQWSSCDEAGRNALAFRRYAKDGSALLFVFNFCPNEYRGFRCEVGHETYWHEILSTDEKCYGGSGNYENGIRESFIENGRAVISVDMAPLSAAVFRLV